MGKKQIVYMNKETGDIKFVRTTLEGKLLGDGWTQMQFITNEKGKRIMRANFGSFTLDVMEDEERST